MLLRNIGDRKGAFALGDTFQEAAFRTEHSKNSDLHNHTLQYLL